MNVVQLLPDLLILTIGKREIKKNILFVTQDESIFYANDGKNNLWLMEGEILIRKKGPGSSIMVSEFQCPCHGTMKIKNWTSRTLFKAGDIREDWWTYKHMVEQLEENTIGLFDALHPDCTAVFLFDNSFNDGAYPNNSLVVNRMTLNEKPWSVNEKYQFFGAVITWSNGEVLNQYHCDFKKKIFEIKLRFIRFRLGSTLSIPIEREAQI